MPDHFEILQLIDFRLNETKKQLLEKKSIPLLTVGIDVESNIVITVSDEQLTADKLRDLFAMLNKVFEEKPGVIIKPDFKIHKSKF